MNKFTLIGDTYVKPDQVSAVKAVNYRVHVYVGGVVVEIVQVDPIHGVDPAEAAERARDCIVNNLETLLSLRR